MHSLLLAMLCLMEILTNAQALMKNTKAATGFYLKINPLALLETDGGIAISGEYVMAKPRLGFQLEVQPIFFSLGNRKGYSGPEAPVRTTRSGMPLGIEVRPELRYYFTFDKQRRTTGPMFRFSKIKHAPTYISTGRRNYVAIDFLYKNVVRQRQSESEIFSGSTTPVFRQKYNYDDLKQVAGWNIKFGSVSPLSKNGRWFLDYYIGFGGRYKNFQYKNLPIGVASPNRLPVFVVFANINEGRQISRTSDISIPAGVRLVYRL